MFRYVMFGLALWGFFSLILPAQVLFYTYMLFGVLVSIGLCVMLAMWLFDWFYEWRSRR